MAAIRFYRDWLSPYSEWVARCRYQPTCSEYALLRLEEDGFWTGNLRIAGRLTLCSPIGFFIDWLNEG